MRVLHTSDLHLGKRLGEASLHEDQHYILDQIKDILVDKKCDALVIAGDVYQRSDPSAESMELFSSFIYDVSKLNIKVMAVSGNHDSGLRLSYFSKLVRDNGIFISDMFSGDIEKVTLNGVDDVRVNFFLLPFIRPSDVKKYYPMSDQATFNEAVKTVIDRIDIDPEEINILIAHQYITGSVTSESEDSYIGGLDNVDSNIFDKFDYVALGHLHRPQYINIEKIRYSGSPLKYSISEADDIKSCVVVDLKSKNDISIETVDLVPLHNVRDIHGLLQEVINMPYSEDYVRVELNDEDVPPDARILLSSTVFPNMIRFAVNNSKTSSETEIDISENIENKSILELFKDFYSLQNNGVEPDDARIKIINDIVESIGDSDHETM